jgi:membrane-associated phospholipid phosphatase
MLWLKLRASEWVFLGFFAYIAILGHWFPERPHLGSQPASLLLAVFALLCLLSRLEHTSIRSTISVFRDFLPAALTLVAFREMELFLPRDYDFRLEQSWIGWDRLLLDHWHLRAATEALGYLVPLYLELCYLLVYGLPIYCIVILYLQHKRSSVDRFLVIYLVGTLTAYGLFPFFPSQPPRIVFPGTDLPTLHTIIRTWNLAILDAATIHVGVFPSAHVSSAFAAGWGMFLVFSKRHRFGWILTIYAASVSFATIYGRYHYTADVVAGFAISLIAAIVALLMQRARPDPA